MENKYSHLNESQRKAIYQQLAAGRSQKEAAKKAGCSASAVSRELSRNKDPGLNEYLPDTAQKLSEQRRRRPGSKIERSGFLKEKIKAGLENKMSPEAIAGRLELESGQQMISHESIYKWIYGEGNKLCLQQYLVRKKRKRGKRPSRKVDKTGIPNRVSIHERPTEYAEEFGHWEGDTVYLSGGTEAIVTLYEKTTKLTLGAKMTTRKTDETIEFITALLSPFPAKARRSITFDNGKEFTNHQKLHEDLEAETYFCDPHSPWQKGGVENANGIIRRSIPKGSKSKDYSPQRVQDCLRNINNTPRKSLDFFTPYESFLKSLTGNTILMPLLTNSIALQV